MGIVTLEPPALAPTFGKLDDGMRQYTAWVAFAAAALKSNGLLVVVCRSRTMTADKLFRFINLGVWSAKRKATVVHRSQGAGADFPVNLSLPDQGLQTVALRI